MRRVYRHESNVDYWDRRWAAEPDLDGFTDLSVYPIRYAEQVVGPGDRILEIGCGPGRVLKHYAARGHDVVGVERSEIAVKRLVEEGYDATVGDVLDLPYPTGRFDVALAFGVYHNLPDRHAAALAETARILRPGGRFCVSVRPDNIEMRANEVYWRWRNRAPRDQFHKILFGESEFAGMLADAGLVVEQTWRATNVSLLWRVPWLRTRDGGEADRRAAGYRLNRAGRTVHRALRTVAPYQTANVIVYAGRRH